MIKKSYAKVNLGLKIVNQRLDGYHNINSIFIQIDFHDILQFIPSHKFKLESEGIHVPVDKANTIFTVVDILCKQYNIDIKNKIIIKKNIPIGAGLGGGSSNAAIALKTLSDLYNLELSMSDLINLAKMIGSDVPFFFTRGN